MDLDIFGAFINQAAQMKSENEVFKNGINESLRTGESVVIGNHNGQLIHIWVESIGSGEDDEPEDDEPSV